MTQRFTLPVAVFIILQNDNGEILLARRRNTGHADGHYGLPAGHIDGDESLAETVCREAHEELGIHISPSDVELAHVQHVRKMYLQQPAYNEYLDFYFTIKMWDGTPTIMEPDKCDDLRWVPLDALPDDTIDYVKDALMQWQGKQRLSELGW